MSDNTQRSRSFLVSAVGGITLLLLAVSVFSVAVKARAVSSGAEITVELVESLRVVSLSRSELSAASRLDAARPDDVEPIEAAIANAADAIDAAGVAIEDNELPDLVANFEAYRRAAEAQAALLLEPGHNESAALVAEAATGSAFDAFASDLRQSQTEALLQLGEDNEFMNTIGTVATFIVAFVVPSAALYIFEALRRSPRYTRELDLRSARLESRTTAAVMALQREVATLRVHLFAESDASPAHRDANIRRSLLRLDNMCNVNGGVRSWSNETVDLAAVVAEVVESFDEDESIRVDNRRVRSVNGDPVQIALIVNELLRNAFHHGARPVSVEVRDGDAVSVTVVDHGPGLTPLVEAAVLLEREYALRNNLADGRFGYGLFAARLAADSMGASLSYEREDGRTRLSLKIPAIGRESVDPPMTGEPLAEAA